MEVGDYFTLEMDGPKNNYVELSLNTDPKKTNTVWSL